MDNKKHTERIIRAFLRGIGYAGLLVVGVPLFAAIEVESPLAILSLLVLIVGFYSMLYLY